MDYTLFKAIAKLPQEALVKALPAVLKDYYDQIYSNDDYVYAVGDIPIALVAHLDTVFSNPPVEEDIFYDREKNVIWSSSGGIGDDRAGVYAILNIVGDGYRPSIIFTTNEEIGGDGAWSLVADYEEPKTELKYIIELDRQGSDDCVFYQCANEEFRKYVEGYEFVTALGSFSDISIIAPYWQVAAVNLSIGYLEEHSYSERLYVDWLEHTIQRVEDMLTDIPETSFKYIESEKYKFGLDSAI